MASAKSTYSSFAGHQFFVELAIVVSGFITFPIKIHIKLITIRQPVVNMYFILPASKSFILYNSLLGLKAIINIHNKIITAILKKLKLNGTVLLNSIAPTFITLLASVKKIAKSSVLPLKCTSK